eukprot:TRINITY_DN37503_c0_g1_i1.p1 TRINITY_DN37503_c0_g1~~TRINITY_DN37503_c0_g1_i1.p1  ORF type:complete len:316 (+),score=79.17 TRINITY_DN37503_c0_g1_i1:78-1025(+)
MAAPRPPRIVFSDLDGTLVHFEKHFREHGRIEERDDAKGTALYVCRSTGARRRCVLLPTSTMGPGLMSERTRDLIAAIRACGTEFVYITGARKSTLIERLPILPEADAAAAETGGRLYDRGALDPVWSGRIEQLSGPLDSSLPPESRQGALWDWYRTLRRSGFKVDSRSYFCCFRVSVSAEGADRLRSLMTLALPPGITCAQNLGKYDYFPAVSGKGNVVRYLLTKRGYAAADAVAMFDDDNDLPMAAAVGTSLVVQATHDAVRRAVAANPHWTVAKQHGPLAAEELLELVLAACGGKVPPSSPPERPDTAPARL